MNILYASVHSILEHGECRLFLDLGHDVFSIHGAYHDGKGDGSRSPLAMKDHTHLQQVALQCSRENLHQEIIDWADVIIVMHRADWIESNWGKLKKKKVILRTIGQNTESNERDLKRLRKEGLLIVRYSPMEKKIPEYVGEDVCIRFYKDQNEYDGYNGNNSQIINLSQAMFGNDTVRSRGDHMSIDLFKKVVEGFPWKIFGRDNDLAGEHWAGSVSHEDLKAMMRFNRVFFYTGTRPASYTLAFIEALMVGMPIVSIGEVNGNSIYNQQTFEIPSIIENGKDGFFSDDINTLREYIRNLLEDKELALKIGREARQKAISLFGKDNIMKQWRDFLEAL